MVGRAANLFVIVETAEYTINTVDTFATVMAACRDDDVYVKACVGVKTSNTVVGKNMF